VKITGRVCKGFGAAQNDVRAGVYEMLRFDPYPGTLNLKVGPGLREVMPIPDLVIPFAHNPLEVWYAMVGAQQCAVMHPIRYNPSRYPIDVVELLAPVRLRDAFNLKDGSELEVTLCPPHSMR